MWSRSKAIVVGGFDIRHFVQCRKEFFTGTAGGALLQPFPGRQVFGEGCGEDFIHGTVLRPSDLNRLLVLFVVYAYVDAHWPSLNMLRNPAGVVTRTPSRSAPTKSLMLWVTIEAPHWTATSRIRSSSGSRKLGRRRSTNGTRLDVLKRSRGSRRFPPRQ